MYRKTVIAIVLLAVLRSPISARPIPIPKPHYQALCRVDGQGRVRCVRADQLDQLLSEAQVQQLLEIADQLFPGLAGKGHKKNTLVGCGHADFVSTSLAIPAPPAMATSGLPGQARHAPAFPTAAEAEGMASQCRAVVQSGLTRAMQDAGEDHDRYVSETVTRMDAAVADCHEEASPFAISAARADWDDAKARFNDAYRELKAKYTAHDAVMGNPALTEATVALSNAGDTAVWLMELFAKAALLKDPKERKAKQALLTGMLNAEAQSLEDLAKPKKPSTPGGPASGGGPGPAPSEPVGPSTPCQGEDCKSSCAELAARWNQFKASCEQSHWNAFNCVAFLAAANRCVDPRLINPGPDGDVTCPARARLDKWGKAKLAWVDQCKKRKWIMTPTDRGDYVCVAPNLGAVPPKFDPCNNPRVLTSPDQCGGPAPSIPKPPRPAPPRPDNRPN